MGTSRHQRPAATGAAARVARRAALLVASCAVLLVSGCASLPGAAPTAESALAAPARDCLTFLGELDRAIDVAGVRDAGQHRVPGFPYLRSDRFTASFAARFSGAPAAPEAARSDDAAYRDWIGRLRSIDRHARQFEVSNLPPASFPILGSADPAQVLARTDECANLLLDQHAAQPVARQRLAGLVAVPDDYSTVKRIVGLYPLTGIGLAAGIRQWHEESRAAFERQRLLPDSGRVVFHRYLPAEGGTDAASARVAAADILRVAPVDALGIPRLSPEATLKLAQAFAPTFEIATSAEHDRFGPLQWIDLKGLVWPGSEPFWLDVDPSQPVVYYQAEYTRLGSDVLPQIVYTIWFPERPGGDAGELEAGRLDGLVWRVTLTRAGEPLLYDSIHPCGCYHQFFPTARLALRPQPAGQELEEWAFVPIDRPIEEWVERLETPKPVGPLALRISTNTHQLVGVALPRDTWGDPVAQNAPYRLVPIDRLRAMPLPGGGTRSIYGPDGLVAGTERLERWFLWPAGIDSPGAMRQYGRHATAFVGRRHFDDADLVERRFQRR